MQINRRRPSTPATPRKPRPDNSISTKSSEVRIKTETSKRIPAKRGSNRKPLVASDSTKRRPHTAHALANLSFAEVPQTIPGMSGQSLQLLSPISNAFSVAFEFLSKLTLPSPTVSESQYVNENNGARTANLLSELGRKDRRNIGRPETADAMTFYMPPRTLSSSGAPIKWDTDSSVDEGRVSHAPEMEGSLSELPEPPIRKWHRNIWGVRPENRVPVQGHWVMLGVATALKYFFETDDERQGRFKYTDGAIGKAAKLILSGYAGYPLTGQGSFLNQLREPREITLVDRHVRTSKVKLSDAMRALGAKHKEYFETTPVPEMIPFPYKYMQEWTREIFVEADKWFHRPSAKNFIPDVVEFALKQVGLTEIIADPVSKAIDLWLYSDESRRQVPNVAMEATHLVPIKRDDGKLRTLPRVSLRSLAQTYASALMRTLDVVIAAEVFAEELQQLGDIFVPVDFNGAALGQLYSVSSLLEALYIRPKKLSREEDAMLTEWRQLSHDQKTISSALKIMTRPTGPTLDLGWYSSYSDIEIMDKIFYGLGMDWIAKLWMEVKALGLKVLRHYEVGVFYLAFEAYMEKFASNLNGEEFASALRVMRGLKQLYDGMSLDAEQ